MNTATHNGHPLGRARLLPSRTPPLGGRGSCRAESQLSTLNCRYSPTNRSPSIPARPHHFKNTEDLKGNEKSMPGLKPRLPLVSLASFLLGRPLPTHNRNARIPDAQPFRELITTQQRQASAPSPNWRSVLVAWASARVVHHVQAPPTARR